MRKTPQILPQKRVVPRPAMTKKEFRSIDLSSIRASEASAESLDWNAKLVGSRVNGKGIVEIPMTLTDATIETDSRYQATFRPNQRVRTSDLRDIALDLSVVRRLPNGFLNSVELLDNEPLIVEQVPGRPGLYQHKIPSRRDIVYIVLGDENVIEEVEYLSSE